MGCSPQSTRLLIRLTCNADGGLKFIGDSADVCLRFFAV